MLLRVNDLGYRLRMKRLGAGLSRKHLTKYFGGKPSARSIQYWEQGDFGPSPEYLVLIKAFLKMDPQAIDLRVKSLGIKPQRRKGRNRHGK